MDEDLEMRVAALELALEEIAATLNESTREEGIARLRRQAQRQDDPNEREVMLKAADLLDRGN